MQHERSLWLGLIISRESDTPAESISHSDSTPPREIEQTVSVTSPPVKVYCVAFSVLVYALFQIIHII